MNKYLVVICSLVLVDLGCNFSTKNVSKVKSDSIVAESKVGEKAIKYYVDSLDFLKDCKLMKKSWEGSLQGIKKPQDSIGNLCFSACYDCRETYEMIFLLKGGVGRRSSLGL